MDPPDLRHAAAQVLWVMLAGVGLAVGGIVWNFGSGGQGEIIGAMLIAIAAAMLGPPLGRLFSYLSGDPPNKGVLGTLFGARWNPFATRQPLLA